MKDPIQALAAAALLATAAPVVAEPITIRNVSVIPVHEEGLLEARDVIVEDGRVVAIKPHDPAAENLAGQVIDGTGRFLMPALWDAHVHIHADFADGESRSEDAINVILPRYLGYGVVGLRDTGMMPGRYGTTMEALGGRNDLPTLVASGPLIDGPRTPWTTRMAVNAETAEEARAVANRLADEGVDFFKVYDTLSADGHAAVAQVAAERGIPLAGHVSFALTPGAAIANGQRFIEHLYVSTVNPCASLPEDARMQILQAWMEGYGAKYDRMSELFASRDPEACADVYRGWAEAGVVVTPMLSMEVPLDHFVSNKAALMSLSRSIEICQRALGTMRAVAAPSKDGVREQLFAVTKSLHDNGVTLMAGADNGGECRSDGLAIHHEIGLLDEAGLGELEALRAATLNVARALGFEDRGYVAEGARAELLILSANPLENSANTLAIWGLVKGDRYFSAADLARLRALDVAPAD